MPFYQTKILNREISLEYEKKDDVPARLSKNEFVFTADAVRAAGGGNINKGAKRMYETMKNLEAQPTAKRMIA